MNTKQLFQQSIELAEKYKHQFVTTDHIFYTLCNASETSSDLDVMFNELGIELPIVVNSMREALETSDKFPKLQPGLELRPTSAFMRYSNTVRKMAMMQQLPQESQVSIFNLLTELLFNEGTFAEFFIEQFQVSVDDMLSFLEEHQHDDTFRSTIPHVDNSNDSLSSPFTSPPKLAPGKALDTYCNDITQRARDGKITKLVGRTQEVADITQILARRNKNNAVLIGEPGVGKTQIVEGLALAIAKNKVPDALKNKRILSLNVGDIVAGAKFRGDFEQRIKQIIDDLTDTDILFIDEIHTMMGAGAGMESTLDMANILKPKLASGEISVIGATTYKEFQKHFAKDEALCRRFLQIDVKEPTDSETRKIINGVKANFEKHHSVTYTKEAIDAVMSLSERYMQQRFWPDKAIDLLDAAGARMVSNNETGDVTVEHIAFEVARIANLPIDALVKSEAVRMKSLKTDLSKQVFGQNDAIDKLNDSVLVARAGLRGKASIQGGYLFVGPSGCGKTEIAKALSTSLNSKLIRFDMSEFSEKHTVSTLIGSPPGYVGHDNSEGKLIEALQKAPDAILLFDEVEKAHPDVFNLFLQMLDEGHISSVSSGKTVSMQNVTLIMTTNLGAGQSKQQGMGYSESTQDDGIDKAVKKFFRPEFLNRLDGIVKFNALQKPTLVNIAKKFIKDLNVDTKAHNVVVKLHNDVINWIVEHGADDKYGARPMKRLITEHIKKQLATEMLFGELVDGGTANFIMKRDRPVLVKNEQV